MDSSRLTATIAVSILIFILVIVISMGFFSLWIFFGLLFYVGLFFGGYSFIIVSFNLLEEQNASERNRKNKFDWCFERINVILKRMTGGQGIQWDGGTGRHSEFRSYFDGVQNKPFRSMMGFLSHTQQSVLIIFDIDNDDIVRFSTNPNIDLVQNHFHDFNPFKRQTSINRMNSGRPLKYNSRYKNGKTSPVSIHLGNDDDSIEDYNNLQRVKPDKNAVDDIAGKL